MNAIETRPGTTLDSTVLASPPTAVLILPDDDRVAPVRRLVVVVPDADVDESALAQCVWSLASTHEVGVLYVGMIPSPDEDSPARRRLATLAALTRDDRIAVDIQVQPDRDWLRVVQRVWHPGDWAALVADRAEWGKTLVSLIAAPVYVLSGFQIAASRRPRRVPRFVMWTALALTVAGVFIIQALVDRLTSGGARLALLSLSVIVEFGLIGLLNQLLS